MKEGDVVIVYQNLSHSLELLFLNVIVILMCRKVDLKGPKILQLQVQCYLFYDKIYLLYYFYKHKTLPPTTSSTSENKDNHNNLPSSPRAPPHGCEYWLIAGVLFIFVVILLVLWAAAQDRI